MTHPNKQLYCFKIRTCQITNNRDEVIKATEEFYRELYSSNGRQTEDEDLQLEIMNIEVPFVNTSEIKKALKVMSKDKTKLHMVYQYT